MAKTLGPFVSLDQRVYTDGESHHAHLTRALSRNANVLISQCRNRLLSYGWPIADLITGAGTDSIGYRLTTIGWKPVTPLLHTTLGTYTRDVAMQLHAQIPLGRTVYAWVGADDRTPPTDQTDSRVLAMVGTGARAYYPGRGAANLFRVPAPRDAALTLWIGDFGGVIAVNNASANSTGTIEMTFGNQLQDAADSFATIDGLASGSFHTHDLYVQIVSGGSLVATKRIRSAGSLARSFRVEGTFDRNYGGDTWNLVRGADVRLCSLALYEAEYDAAALTASTYGHKDESVYAQERFSLHLRHLNATNDTIHARRRVLVCDPWIQPKQRVVSSTAYQTCATYPVELSRRGGEARLHVKVLAEASAFSPFPPAFVDVEVNTENLAGGGAETNATDPSRLLPPFSYASFYQGHREIESRFASPHTQGVELEIEPTVNEADVTTYRQIVQIRMKKKDADAPDVVFRGAYVWEV